MPLLKSLVSAPTLANSLAISLPLPNDIFAYNLTTLAAPALLLFKTLCDKSEFIPQELFHIG
jgi:hypothetical protein